VISEMLEFARPVRFAQPDDFHIVADGVRKHEITRKRLKIIVVDGRRLFLDRNKMEQALVAWS
jgi:hypothetical protein